MDLSAPTLTTARLILRAHTREDYHALHTVWSDPLVTKFIGRRPSSAPSAIAGHPCSARARRAVDAVHGRLRELS